MENSRKEQLAAVEKALDSFLKSCTRRDGGKFAVKAKQYDAQDNLTSLKGTVDNTEMFWNVNGQALTNDRKYDLVKEVSI